MWIEIVEQIQATLDQLVTPYAGVWIEIPVTVKKSPLSSSLPTRECGLKSENDCFTTVSASHSLRGSVD